MTVATFLRNVIGRPSDDRVLGTDLAVVELDEIAFRPDLMIRWDDETVVPASIACTRVPTPRARCTSTTASRPTTLQR